MFSGGILFIVLPTVVYGGLSLLGFLTKNAPGYSDNPMRHDLWRAGHAMASVFLVLSLVMLPRYVDDEVLRDSPAIQCSTIVFFLDAVQHLHDHGDGEHTDMDISAVLICTSPPGGEAPPDRHD